MLHASVERLPAVPANISRRSSSVAGQRPLPRVLVARLPSQRSTQQHRDAARSSRRSGRRRDRIYCFAVPASPRGSDFVTSSFLVDLPAASSGAPLRPLPRAVEVSSPRSLPLKRYVTIFCCRSRQCCHVVERCALTPSITQWQILPPESHWSNVRDRAFAPSH